MNNPNRARPQFVVENAGKRQKMKPMKPRRWSHQQELDAAKGKQITVMFTDGSTRSGELVEADAYAVKMRVSVDQDCKSVLTDITFYKHSIGGYGLG